MWCSPPSWSCAAAGPGFSRPSSWRSGPRSSSGRSSRSPTRGPPSATPRASPTGSGRSPGPPTRAGPPTTSSGSVSAPPSPRACASRRTSTPRVRGTNDLYLLVLGEVYEVDLAQRVEIVARARQTPLGRVLDLDLRDEPPPPPAPPAREGTPGGAVVPPPLAVRALAEAGVADRYSSHGEILSRGGSGWVQR